MRVFSPFVLEMLRGKHCLICFLLPATTNHTTKKSKTKKKNTSHTRKTSTKKNTVHTRKNKKHQCIPQKKHVIPEKSTKKTQFIPQKKQNSYQKKTKKNTSHTTKKAQKKTQFIPQKKEQKKQRKAFSFLFLLQFLLFFCFFSGAVLWTYGLERS
jgi:uncharacterized membrane protein